MTTQADPLSTLPTSQSTNFGARGRRTEQITEEMRTCADEHALERLREELIALNMPVAESIAGRYRSRGIALDDLQQVAYLALTKAAQRFDPESGHAFLSFCVPTIRGEVRRYFRDQGWMVRPPRRIQELQQAVMRAQSDLTAELGRPATPRELSEQLDEELDDVLEALDGRGAFSPTSLDRPVGQEHHRAPLGELLGEEDVGGSAAEARVTLAPVVRRLSARDRRILRLRFFDGLTQREIAEDIGVTQMQVSRLLTRIYRDARKEIGAIDLPIASA